MSVPPHTAVSVVWGVDPTPCPYCGRSQLWMDYGQDLEVGMVIGGWAMPLWTVCCRRPRKRREHTFVAKLLARSKTTNERTHG